jgi:hypothetical protein
MADNVMLPQHQWLEIARRRRQEVGERWARGFDVNGRPNQPWAAKQQVSFAHAPVNENPTRRALRFGQKREKRRDRLGRPLVYDSDSGDETIDYTQRHGSDSGDETEPYPANVNGSGHNVMLPMFGTTRNRQTYNNRGRVGTLAKVPSYQASYVHARRRLDNLNAKQLGSGYTKGGDCVCKDQAGNGYQEGGFLFLLAPLAAIAAEALAGITVSGMVTAAATGAATAAGAAAYQSVVGSGTDFLSADDLTEADHKHFSKGVRSLGVKHDDIRLAEHMMPRMKQAFLRKVKKGMKGSGVSNREKAVIDRLIRVLVDDARII